MKNHASMPEDPQILSVYDSMAQCARALGIPLALVKRAKKDGSSAFRSNRVYTLPLIQWLADHKQKVVEPDARSDFQRSQALRERIKAATDAKMVISRELAERRYRENQALLFQDLRKRFIGTLPPLYKGLDTAGQADLNERELNAVQAMCEDRAKRIGVPE